MAQPENDPTPPPGHAGASPDTDPGRAHPYESLYRGGNADPSTRPTPRHYEQALSRPDGTREGQFGWLYRDDDQAPDQTRVNPVLGGARTVPAAARPVSPPPPAAEPVTAMPPQSPEPPRTRKRSGYTWVIALLALILVIAGGVAVGTMLSPQESTRSAVSSEQPRASVPAEQSASVPASEPADPAVIPEDADVSCQAPPATDDAGNKVSYTPEQMFDGNPETAWRCDGKGVDQTVIFNFDDEVSITSLGVLNGYSKIDPASGAHRYGEYRRVTAVRWTFPDGTAFEHELSDDVETAQTLKIPETKADKVTMTILSSTAPGSKAKTRNAVLISEATFSS